MTSSLSLYIFQINNASDLDSLSSFSISSI